jgi:hypothetical protein
VVEFMPLIPKVVIGIVLSTVAAVGAAESWFAKRREQRSRDENR